ncbi:MAG: cysteine peptidase family C39 domain-containing protein, partial [Candidatus Omnitrophica bacterium]|nr:cysteine peptidase family C39 domain-containing protein [Candidatus Omnitrophota bacterium]
MAFIVVVIFMPEQVAQAAGFDPGVIWQKPAFAAGALAARTFAPGYANKDLNSLDIPLTIKQILKDVSNKPVDAIQLSPTVTIKLGKPLKLSSQRIEEIYNWLKGKTCGSKALYELLNYQGVKTTEQDIAVFALTVDILNGITKPEGNPEVIKSSLYALSRVSEFFGLKLYAVKINTSLRANVVSEAISKGLASSPSAPSNDILEQMPTPFIAHFKDEHYVLVTNITADKVYYIEEHKEEFLPKDKFLAEFSGYALTQTANSGTQLTDAQAMKIMGARSSRRDKAMDTFGLVGAGAMFATTKISNQSWSTFARNYAVTYAAPKLLKTIGFNNTISNIGGAFVSGAVLSGMDYKWDRKAMLSQAATWGVAAAVQEYGYSRSWDKKMFVGATNLASNILGDITLKKLSGNSFGVYQYGDESRPAYRSGNTLVGNGLPKYIDMDSFKANIYPGAREYIGDAARLLIEDKMGNHDFAKGLGTVASGIISGGSAKDVLMGSVVQGVTSVALTRATQDIMGLGPYAGSIASLYFTATLRGQFSQIEGQGSRSDLTKYILKGNIQQAIGGFFSGGMATLNPAGNLYYNSAPNARFAANMLDFNRTANGLPSTTWTRDDWNQHAANPSWRPDNSGFFPALLNRFVSNVHYQAADNVTGLLMDKINDISWAKQNGTWNRKKWETDSIKRLGLVSDKEGKRIGSTNDKRLVPEALKVSYRTTAPYWNMDSFTFDPTGQAKVKGKIKVNGAELIPIAEVSSRGIGLHVLLEKPLEGVGVKYSAP